MTHKVKLPIDLAHADEKLWRWRTQYDTSAKIAAAHREALTRAGEPVYGIRDPTREYGSLEGALGRG